MSRKVRKNWSAGIDAALSTISVREAVNSTIEQLEGRVLLSASATVVLPQGQPIGPLDYPIVPTPPGEVFVPLDYPIVPTPPGEVFLPLGGLSTAFESAATPGALPPDANIPFVSTLEVNGQSWLPPGVLPPSAGAAAETDNQSPPVIVNIPNYVPPGTDDSIAPSFSHPSYNSSIQGSVPYTPPPASVSTGSSDSTNPDNQSLGVSVTIPNYEAPGTASGYAPAPNTPPTISRQAQAPAVSVTIPNYEAPGTALGYAPAPNIPSTISRGLQVFGASVTIRNDVAPASEVTPDVSTYVMGQPWIVSGFSGTSPSTPPGSISTTEISAMPNSGDAADGQPVLVLTVDLGVNGSVLAARQDKPAENASAKPAAGNGDSSNSQSVLSSANDDAVLAPVIVAIAKDAKPSTPNVAAGTLLSENNKSGKAKVFADWAVTVPTALFAFGVLIAGAEDDREHASEQSSAATPDKKR